MKEVSSLLDYRSSVKVLDATLRDGGLVNDFYFTDEFVKALYMTNIKAGIDYMEMGYRADKTMFDEDKFGAWKFADDDKIWSIIGEKDPDLKLAIMADVGRCNYKEDIKPKSESPIDLVRVATYITTIPMAVKMIEDADRKGYETTCNIMAISGVQETDLKVALDILGKSPAKAFYIVDSFGSLVPEQVARIVDVYMEAAAKYGKEVGMHAHNNQQLAFANTIEAVGDGCNWLDATYAGMGRGAGNCAMELLLGILRNPKFNIYPAFKFIEKYMMELKESGVVWGYDLQYLMTGILNQHPRTAIAFTKEKRNDYSEFYKELIVQD